MLCSFMHCFKKKIKEININGKNTGIKKMVKKVKELEKSINLIIKTKCPTKWIIEDLETGQKYRANGKTEIGQMFTPIS